MIVHMKMKFIKDYDNFKFLIKDKERIKTWMLQNLAVSSRGFYSIFIQKAIDSMSIAQKEKVDAVRFYFNFFVIVSLVQNRNFLSFKMLYEARRTFWKHRKCSDFFFFPSGNLCIVHMNSIAHVAPVFSETVWNFSLVCCFEKRAQ